MSILDKPLVWVGTSKRDLMSLPASIRNFFGYALGFAQKGLRHDSTKIMQGFGNAGVIEILEDAAGGTYRAVYTVNFKNTVFVLHCFQKKSKSGIATPKEDMEIIHKRLKMAESIFKGL